ncbi:DUF547 domain-containing protein [Photobacterium sp. GJ3]|uniref:DUF547 domain-containing protein n=1 Tax=Photobacterium sp. GJ3 TaxID=2829502 RepID=UPI001B8D368B|nr:DUF547 domain-containing protein [Photobacterium sp. GJ3]QUJ66958.1 DUF547 domain-containing protein [Photobacterium sp. GJ3]
MMKKLYRMAVLFLLLLSGCSSKIPLEHVSEASTNHLEEAKEGWRLVLHQHVNEFGRVDFQGVAGEIAQLEKWLSYVAAHSPDQSPQAEQFNSKEKRLGYYIDAYNALAMYGVLRSGVLPEDKIQFFLLRKYQVGNEWMSLYELENELIRKEHDLRIHFALNCMSASCPPLQQTTWDADTLDEALEQATTAFINDPKQVWIAHKTQTIWVSELFDFYPEDFGPLIPLINQYRQEPVPTDYKIAFIPYNWALISQ